MEELINGTEPVKDLVASKSISEIQKELEGFGQKDPMPMLIPNWNSSRYSQGDHLSGQSNPKIGIPSPSALVPTRVSTQVPSHGNHSLPHVIPGSPLKTGSRLIKISELSNIQRLTNPEVQADGQEHRAQIKILNPTKLNLKASQVHNNRVFPQRSEFLLLDVLQWSFHYVSSRLPEQIHQTDLLESQHSSGTRIHQS